MTQRDLHEVWKFGHGEWKVQCLKGILTFRTRKAANDYSRKARRLIGYDGSLKYRNIDLPGGEI